MEAIETGDFRLFFYRQFRGLDFFAPGGDIVDLVGQVGAGGAAIDVFFHADVRLEIACVHPEAFALEHRRARDFLHAQEAEIELPSLGQLGERDVDLRVIDADHLHLRAPSASRRTRSRYWP